MSEIMQSQTDILESEVIKETQTSLSELTESVAETMQQKKYEFANYLKKEGVDEEKFSLASGMQNFFHTFRYYPEISETAKHAGIPMEYFFALNMIEGEGNPVTINTADGGAGISQIQPDTLKWFDQTYLKKDLKVFSDNPAYKAWDYDVLLKKHSKEKNPRKETNADIAKKLLAIRNDCNGDITKLSAIDDRFNPKIALDFSAQYLLYCKKQINLSKLKGASWDKYKKDPKFDFQWLLALNGYNKGPKNFAKNFTGSHISHFKSRLTRYRKYSTRLESYIAQGLSNEQILEKFRDIKSKGKKEIKENISGLEYKNISKDGKWNIYKFTFPTAMNVYPTDTMQLLQLMKVYQKFVGKTFQLTDEKGIVLNSKKYPTEKGSVIYIKEKIGT